MLNDRDWGPGNPVWEDLQDEKVDYSDPAALRVANLAAWFALGGTVPVVRAPNPLVNHYRSPEVRVAPDGTPYVPIFKR